MIQPPTHSSLPDARIIGEQSKSISIVINPVTVSHAPVADHVTTLPRSRGTFNTRLATTGSRQHMTSDQLIKATSFRVRDASTETEIDDLLDRNKPR